MSSYLAVQMHISRLARAGLIRELITSEKISISSSSSSDDEKDDTDSSASAMLLDLEALDCPICYDAMTSSIFQCVNGHLVCSTCCNKLRNKCPSCTLPFGHIRCRAMERVIKSVTVPCPNAKRGCKMRFSYGKESTDHEKECAFSLCSCPAKNCKYCGSDKSIYNHLQAYEYECALSLCSCPAKNCNYSGSYKNLFNHFQTHKSEKGCGYRFIAGGFPEVICFELSEYTTVVMNESKDGLLFVVRCVSKPHGVYVTMNCIAPSVPEVCEFSCHISTVVKEYNMTYDLPKVKRVRKLSSETPIDDFMLVPRYFLCGCQTLKLRICVRKFTFN